MNRREFLRRSPQAGLAAAAGVTLLARAESVWAAPANERIVLAVVGIRTRGNTLAAAFAQRPDCGVAWLCDVDGSLLPSRSASLGELEKGAAAALRAGLPQGPGRQVGRRRGDRHARPLALPGRHPGLRGGQGRVRRVAAEPQLLGRPPAGRDGAARAADRADGAREPQCGLCPKREEIPGRREAGHDPLLPRPGPEGAEQFSAEAQQPHAQGARLGHVERSRHRWPPTTSTCTTTGTAGGAIRAATWPSTGSTSWTSPAGSAAWSIPARSTPPGGGSTAAAATRRPRCSRRSTSSTSW